VKFAVSVEEQNRILLVADPVEEVLSGSRWPFGRIQTWRTAGGRMVRDKLLITEAEIDALQEATIKLRWETQLQLLAFRYRNGDDVYRQRLAETLIDLVPDNNYVN
jgi:hypothetical protein